MEEIKKEKNIFITSDTHFGHFNIIGYAGRKFTYLYEMDNALIKNWNELIKADDIVYHLGDVSFNPDQYIDRLNGNIFLIRGNHDKPKYDYLYKEVVDLAEINVEEFKCIMVHEPIILGEIYKKGRTPDFSLLDKYDFIFCGHCHNKWKINGKNINVGVDVWDMKPINIKDLAKFLRSLTTI